MRLKEDESEDEMDYLEVQRRLPIGKGFKETSTSPHTH